MSPVGPPTCRECGGLQWSGHDQEQCDRTKEMWKHVTMAPLPHSECDFPTAPLAPNAPLTFQYDPTPMDTGPTLKEGVTDVWLYRWSGEPGPARALKMAALTDEDGNGVLIPNGEWQDVTVVDDSEDQP